MKKSDATIFVSSNKESLRISGIALIAILVVVLFKIDLLIESNKLILIGLFVLASYLIWNVFSPRIIRVQINNDGSLRITKRYFLKNEIIEISNASFTTKEKVSGQGFKYKELVIETETGSITLTGGKGGWKNDQVKMISETIQQVV